jgi:RHS repeat-associated protein
LSVTFGNSVQGAFTYNDHLQLSTLRYFKGSTEILNLGYDYTTGAPGNNGQIQKMHYYTTPGVEDQTRSEQFTYDGLGRLSAAQTITVNSTAGAKTWSLQWTYDRFGNRLTQSMLAGDPNFLVGQPTLSINPATNQITNSGYTYDNAGNMKHDATAAYAFDGANRLISINATAAVYSYFGSQRIKKVLGTTTTRYIYSGSKPIAEYVNGANASSPSTEYIYAGSQLLVTIAGSATTYHHPDHLSNRAETNSSGTRTRTFGQLPFGETWYETGTADKWKFTSYEHDSGTGETGLDYASFRYYSSPQDRFMNADLLAGNLIAPQSLNRYAYTEGDPVNLVDPMGLDDGIAVVCTSDPQTGDIIECWIYGLPDSFTNPGGPGAGSDVGWSAGNANPGMPGDPCGGGPCGSGTNTGGGGFGDILSTFKRLYCTVVPNGTVGGVGGSLGSFIGVSGTVEGVQNWDTLETSFFTSRGWSGGIVGGQGNVFGGVVWGLSPGNQNYKSGSTTGSASYGAIGGFISGNSPGLNNISGSLNPSNISRPLSIGGSLGIGNVPVSAMLTVSHYSQPQYTIPMVPRDTITTIGVIARLPCH